MFNNEPVAIPENTEVTGVTHANVSRQVVIECTSADQFLRFIRGGQDAPDCREQVNVTVDRHGDGMDVAETKTFTLTK